MYTIWPGHSELLEFVWILYIYVHPICYKHDWNAWLLWVKFVSKLTLWFKWKIGWEFAGMTSAESDMSSVPRTRSGKLGFLCDIDQTLIGVKRNHVFEIANIPWKKWKRKKGKDIEQERVFKRPTHPMTVIGSTIECKLCARIASFALVYGDRPSWNMLVKNHDKKLKQNKKIIT